MDQKMWTSHVIERLKRLLDVTRENELAHAIGINPTTLNAKKQRGDLPYAQIIALARKQGWNLDLIFKETPELANPSYIAEKALGYNEHTALNDTDRLCHLIRDHLTAKETRELLRSPLLQKARERDRENGRD